MISKTLVSSSVFLLAFIPFASANDGQVLLRLESYHGESEEQYCIQAGLPFGPDDPACADSGLMAPFIPDTGGWEVFLPEDQGSDQDRDRLPDQAEAALCGVADPFPGALGFHCEDDDFQQPRDEDLDGVPDEAERVLCGWPDVRAALALLDGQAGRCAGSPSFDYTAPSQVVLPTGAPCLPPSQGDWIIPRGIQVTCLDQDVVVRGNLVVEPLAALALDHSRLRFSDGSASLRTNHLLILERERLADHPYAAALRVRDSVIEVSDPSDQAAITSFFQAGRVAIVIEGSILRDVQVHSHAGSELLLRNSALTGTSRVWSNQGDGTVRILDNLFLAEGPMEPLWFTDGKGVVVSNNTIAGCSLAVVLRGTVPVFEDNTISGCRSTVSQQDCAGLTLRNNDFVGNGHDLPHLCGDAQSNYWGPDGPGSVDSNGSLRIHPWLDQPAHPERLPAIVVDAPGRAFVHQPVVLDASRSQPSTHFAAPLRSYEWDFGDGALAESAVVEHAYREAGSYQVRLAVTDELGIRQVWGTAIDVMDCTPVFEGVDFFPARPVEEEAVHAKARVLDPCDEGRLSVSYTWTREEAVGMDDRRPFEGPWLPAGITRAEDVWRVDVVASDGDHKIVGASTIRIGKALRLNDGTMDDAAPADSGAAGTQLEAAGEARTIDVALSPPGLQPAGADSSQGIRPWFPFLGIVGIIGGLAWRRQRMA